MKQNNSFSWKVISKITLHFVTFNLQSGIKYLNHSNFPQVGSSFQLNGNLRIKNMKFDLPIKQSKMVFIYVNVCNGIEY